MMINETHYQYQLTDGRSSIIMPLLFIIKAIKLMTYLKRLSLICAICLGTFMATLDISIVNVALPTIQNDIHADMATLQWIVDAYALCLSACILSSGPLSDRFGRKKVWLWGVIIFTLGSVICAIAQQHEILILGRIIQGIAAAALIPGALSLITHAFPIDIERVRIIGIWSSVSALSLIIGPILGGVLVHASGWASIFLINIPIGIITVLLGWYGLSESADPENVALDPFGQLTSMLGLGSLTYGLIEAGSVGWSHYRTVSTLIVGIIFLALFLMIEKRIERPLLPLALFKDRTFFQYNLSSFTLGFATYSNVFFIAFFLQKAQGWSALETGWRMAPEFIAMALFSMSFGRLSSNFSVRKLMICGFLFIAISSCLLATLTTDSHYGITGSYLFVLGAGMGLSTPAIGALVMKSVPPSRSGMASATMNALRQTGMTMGIALLGTLMVQQAIHYMVIQSQALGISVNYINIVSLVTENTTSSLDKGFVALLPEAFNSGFAYAIATAGISCFVTLFIVLFPVKAKHKTLTQQITD